MEAAHWKGWGGLVFVAWLVLGASAAWADRPQAAPPTDEQADGKAVLEDVTRAAGIDFVHDAVRDGKYLFPEINGAGCQAAKGRSCRDRRHRSRTRGRMRGRQV